MLQIGFSILAVNMILSALLLVDNSPTCPNAHQINANYYLHQLLLDFLARALEYLILLFDE